MGSQKCHQRGDMGRLESFFTSCAAKIDFRQRIPWVMAFRGTERRRLARPRPSRGTEISHKPYVRATSLSGWCRGRDTGSILPRLTAHFFPCTSLTPLAIQPASTNASIARRFDRTNERTTATPPIQRRKEVPMTGATKRGSPSAILRHHMSDGS